jgi:hypothetical protein
MSDLVWHQTCVLFPDRGQVYTFHIIPVGTVLLGI